MHESNLLKNGNSEQYEVLGIKCDNLQRVIFISKIMIVYYLLYPHVSFSEIGIVKIFHYHYHYLFITLKPFEIWKWNLVDFKRLLIWWHAIKNFAMFIIGGKKPSNGVNVFTAFTILFSIFAKVLSSYNVLMRVNKSEIRICSLYETFANRNIS